MMRSFFLLVATLLGTFALVRMEPARAACGGPKQTDTTGYQYNLATNPKCTGADISNAYGQQYSSPLTNPCPFCRIDIGCDYALGTDCDIRFAGICKIGECTGSGYIVTGPAEGSANSSTKCDRETDTPEARYTLWSTGTEGEQCGVSIYDPYPSCNGLTFIRFKLSGQCDDCTS